MTLAKPRRLRDVLRHLRLDEPAVGLPTEGDLDGMLSPRGRGAMLLDFYAPEDVVEALGRYGVTPKLAARGYANPTVELETIDPRRQFVRVRAERDGRRGGLLGEAILRSGEFTTAAPFASALHGRSLRLLFIQWLLLQDPAREFTPGRPALPGQRHPGLGVGREVMAMFLGMADRLGFEGLASCPEFAHNAVLYGTEFRFLDPAAQGRFEALVAAFAGRSLGELAWAVDGGCLVDDATGEPVRWWHEEMLRPTSAALRAHVESGEYLRRADAARAACRWRFDAGRWAALDPLRSDGAPRHPIE